MSSNLDKYKPEPEGLMADFDSDKYVKAYCRRMKCNSCEGTDFNGEANGYGCQGLEDRVETMFLSIWKRRSDSLNYRGYVNVGKNRFNKGVS